MLDSCYNVDMNCVIIYGNISCETAYCWAFMVEYVSENNEKNMTMPAVDVFFVASLKIMCSEKSRGHVFEMLFCSYVYMSYMCVCLAFQKPVDRSQSSWSTEWVQIGTWNYRGNLAS